MKRINVDLAELQAFACLAEARSFRAAADHLGLTGSAVSRAIARIEDPDRSVDGPSGDPMSSAVLALVNVGLGRW